MRSNHEGGLDGSTGAEGLRCRLSASTRRLGAVEDLFGNTDPVTPAPGGSLSMPSADAPLAVRMRPRTVDEIVGRMDDVFVFDQAEDARVVVTPDVMRNAVLDAARAITDFRILREGHDEIALVLQPDLPEAGAEAARQSLARTFAERGLAPKIQVRRETMVFELHRKLRRVECRFRPGAGP